MADSPKSEASLDSGAAAVPGTSVGTGPATAKPNAIKDRQCQYCRQHFTSSSLGRHFDQFIFKKKPDGIHDVEEIRRLRGAITRRTPKGTLNPKQDRDRDSSQSHSTPQATSPVSHDPSAAEVRADLNATPVEGVRLQLNTPNWHSTGVINGLPAVEARPNGNGKRNYSSIETAAAKDMLGLRDAPASEKETTRALELALREVLDTIQAAR